MWMLFATAEEVDSSVEALMVNTDALTSQAVAVVAQPERWRLAGGHVVESCCLSGPSPLPFQLVMSTSPAAGDRLPSPFGALVWLPLATVQPLTEAAPSTTLAAMVPREQRRLAGEYVVESYAELKSLMACPDNSNAACDFSGKALIMRCNGKTLDAGQAARFFYGSGSGSSLQVHRCVLKNGKTTSSVSVFTAQCPFFSPYNAACSAVSHPTCRAALLQLGMVPTWRFTVALFNGTPRLNL